MDATRKRRLMGEINVVPYIDVMLVLLIIFMVTAPLLTTGLRVELPQVQAHNTPVRDSKLVVTVTKEERIMFGERDVTANVEQALLEYRLPAAEYDDDGILAKLVSDSL